MKGYKPDKNTILSEKPRFSLLHCCICRHAIVNHVKETIKGRQFYRCHSLGPDYFQCECRLDNPYKYVIEFRTTVLLSYDFPEQMFNLKGG